MRSTAAFAELLRLERPIVETREAAVRLGLSASRVSRLLRSLEESGLVRRLRRGLWALRRDLDPYTVPPYLTAPFPAYVSLWSALSRHGMIDQLPRRIFVVSLDRTQVVRTSVGEFSIHHIVPELFGGHREEGQGRHMATPEKAVFDAVYLLAPEGGRMHLPELELPEGFLAADLEEWIARIARPRLRTLVRRNLDRWIEG